MITLKSVNLKFGDFVVLDSFSETYSDNIINCIIGPSGCGKTSLLNLVSGILGEDSGEVTKPDKVSYVFQEDSLVPQKTARKNLELVLKTVYTDKAELKNVIDRFFTISGLENAADLYPHQMSGGMRQRLALIRAFAYPSDVLLMDEPFKALDITLKDSIITSFLDLYKEHKRTVLFVTHDIDEALLTGDQIYIYSNKPMKQIKTYKIPGEKGKRKIYDEYITKLKNEIHKLTETW
ncbi:MAG: ABC transporter ATP-binding protein [Oscillospiraceae bacterium]|nr:ABC transporter ATP-binding protein [Oscillospiraceae bacterium]MCL2279063.1 ABC transporter ATP-binding protein [Oscillospiraceae bacterium]